MKEAAKPLEAAAKRLESEIEKQFTEPEKQRKANQRKYSKDIKALQKSFDEAMDNAQPRLEDDERSRAWNRMVLDYLMFKAEAEFAKALEKGLRKVGKKQWNRFRGPIIKTIQKLANDAASPDGWLAKRLENPSVADRDAIRAFIAEAFGLEKDAIPMGWTYMFDEIAKAMEEMTKGIRGYLPAGPEVAGLLTGPTELEVEPEATEEQPSTAMDAQEALNRAGERFRNRRAAEALAQDTALPETGAEGESDLDGLAGNTALSVGEPKRGDTIVRRTTFDVEEDNERDVGYYYYVNDMPVAYASVRIFKDSTYVERIDVDDDYQNMGFGTRILKQLADEYGDVYVAPDNEDAKRLYERIGYDKVGSRAYNESYYAVDEGYGVYSISGDSNTNIVIEGEDDGAGNVALSVGEDGTKGVDPGRVKSGLADFAKEWKSRGGLEYGDERELNAILDGANRFMDAYFGGAIALSNGGVLRFYPDRRAIERLGLERAWMEYAIHAVTHQKGEGERVRVYSRTKAKTLDDIREIVAADKCVIDKGDLVFIGNNGMSVVAEIVNKDAMRFDEERYITTKFTGSRLRRMAAVPLNTLMAPREGTVKSAGTSPSSTNTIANPGADVKPGNTALSVGGFGLNANARTEMEKVRKQYEGTDKWMKTPNGKPTKLNERQWLQVRTPSFKAWFGDWENDPEHASKVVDENGEPLVVYHQTNSKAYINRETGQEWDRITPEERQAWRDRGDWDEHWEEQDFYTFDNTTHGRRSIEMPAFFFSPEYDEYHEYGNRTVAAFLNLRNPASNPEIPNAGVTDTAGEDAMNALMKQGYDGFIRDDDGAVYEINAFRPEQIKSATDNVGTFDPSVQDIRLSVGDRAYLDAVRRGDMGAARRMVEERATEMGIENPIPEQTDAYKVRVSAPPKKTIKVYKVFTIDQAGRPTALFVSGMDALPMGVWLDAQDTWHFTAKNGKQYVPSTANPNGRGGKTGAAVEIPNEATRQELIKRGFLPQGSKAKTVVALAYRPGWHAGDMPFFPQGGVRRAGSNYGNVHHARQVVFECEMDADHDYTDEARRQPKALTKDGRVNEANADLQSMPEGGFYRYSTNPLTKGGKRGTWFISGSLKINRALTQGEADGILRENGFAPQEWEQGALDLAQLGYRGDESEAARKTLAPVTYDDNGNVIPLSRRFNPAIQDIRFSVGERMGGRAPTVEPGGDVREAGEGALAWLRRKFVHSQTPVFDAVRRVMGVGREPPDALNVEAAAKNVHGKIRARQEMLQRAYLEPLKAILAQPGLDRKRFDDYALALHALERNRMIQERSVVVDPTTGEVVDLGVEAGSGVTNAWAERVIREIQRDPFAAQYKEAANILAEMNRFVLRGAVADGLLTEAQAKTWMRLSPHYVPLILGRLRAGYRRQDAPGEAWKFGGLEVWLWRPVLVVLLVLFVLPRV